MSTASGHTGLLPWLRYIRFRQKLWMGSSPGMVLEFADGYIQLARDFGAAMMPANRRSVFSPLPRRSAAYTLRWKALCCLVLLCCGGLAIFYYVSYYKWVFDDLLRFLVGNLCAGFAVNHVSVLSPIHLTIVLVLIETLVSWITWFNPCQAWHSSSHTGPNVRWGFAFMWGQWKWEIKNCLQMIAGSFNHVNYG